ncbi:MAG TPA: efflux RND transporter periplasmic adaptor subunit, partial [Phycisphaerae bacterium]|nr:efflux RND transporter periplasmic adaptor subunit [Phycisphaerae bacterium]
AVREERLFGERVGAEKDLQAARAGLAAAEAEFVALREEIAFDSQRARREAERAVQVARARLDSADRRLRILGLSAAQIAAIGEEPAEALTRCEVRSPVGGRVVTCDVTRGESVDGARAVFVVADPSRLWLMASVYERDLPALREGLPVQFVVDGLGGRQFEARLTWISSQVDERTRLVPVRAELDNGDAVLRAHMFGQARIALRVNEEVLGVPLDAVQSDGCCQLAFVREADAVWAPRKIELGVRDGGFVEVVRGLEVGEVIATAGTYLMKTEILKGSIGAGCCAVETGR